MRVFGSRRVRAMSTASRPSLSMIVGSAPASISKSSVFSPFEASGIEDRCLAMSPEIESRPIFQEFAADHIIVSLNNSPQRVARISSTCQQEPHQRQIFAPRYGIPEWSGPKISFVLVHRNFNFQIGTSLKERGDRPQPVRLAARFTLHAKCNAVRPFGSATCARSGAAAISASTAAASQALEASKRAVFEGFLILRASRHRHHAHHALCRFSSPRLPLRPKAFLLRKRRRRYRLGNAAA
jgi:hypothetical protein